MGLGISLLAASWVLVFLGTESVWPIRNEPIWPTTSLVSVDPNSAPPDIYSSPVALLSVSLAAAQSLLLVLATSWILHLGGFRGGPSMPILFFLYGSTLVFDWFRLWSGEWYFWLRYRLNMGDLCQGGEQCLGSLGGFPLASFIVLLFLLSQVRTRALASFDVATDP